MKQKEQEQKEEKRGAEALPKNVISIDEGMIVSTLTQVVTRTVEETLNALLEAEAARLCRAKRYEHSAERVDTRAGHCPNTCLCLAQPVIYGVIIISWMAIMIPINCFNK